MPGWSKFLTPPAGESAAGGLQFPPSWFVLSPTHATSHFFSCLISLLSSFVLNVGPRIYFIDLYPRNQEADPTFGVPPIESFE